MFIDEPFASGGLGYWAKLEGTNPGGIKDRPALHMIRRARERGELRPGARGGRHRAGWRPDVLSSESSGDGGTPAAQYSRSPNSTRRLRPPPRTTPSRVPDSPTGYVPDAFISQSGVDVGTITPPAC
jgi:hypothetical protein